MKRLIKAGLWIACYGGACWVGIKSKLGFDILNQNHWGMLFDKSPHAIWPPEMAPKKLVCKILFAFIIVGVLGLSVVIKKKKKRIPVVKGELPEKGNFRPSAMVSQGRIAAPPVVTPAPAGTGAVPAPAQNSMSSAIQKISATANTFEVSIFPHVKLENTFTQLVVSDDATALLLKILPQSGTWQVTTPESPQESMWTIENDSPKNVLKDIMESTATLSKLEPEAEAIAVVILAGGKIQNAREIKDYLNKNNIQLAALDNHDMPDVPTWSQLLGQFYPLKQQEENNEENNHQ